jgi:hypothetical protein
MEPEVQKAYLIKHALQQGILEIYGTFSREQGYFYAKEVGVVEAGDFALTKKQALRRVKSLQRLRIKELEAQISEVKASKIKITTSIAAPKE